MFIIVARVSSGTYLLLNVPRAGQKMPTVASKIRNPRYLNAKFCPNSKEVSSISRIGMIEVLTVDKIGTAKVAVETANTNLMKFSGKPLECKRLNRKLPSITQTIKVANIKPCGSSIGSPFSGCIAGVHMKTKVNIAPSNSD